MPSPPEAALVLQRWNSWVRVYLPSRGEIRWIDLAAAGGCEPLHPPVQHPRRAAQQKRQGAAALARRSGPA